MRLGVFDHMDRGAGSLDRLFSDRLRLVEAYDRAGFYGYHVAEHHATPLGVAPSPGVWLAAIAQRAETTAGRRLRLFTRISDRPGGLAAVLTTIAREGGNVVHADHIREAVSLHVRETGLEIALETRGPAHSDAIVAALQSDGYAVRRLAP